MVPNITGVAEKPAAAERQEKKEVTTAEGKEVEEEKNNKEDEAKSKPQKPPLDYNQVKGGWIQKQGNWSGRVYRVAWAWC